MTINISLTINKTDKPSKLASVNREAADAKAKLIC